MALEKKITDNKEVDLVEIFIIVWKYKWRVFLFFGLALIIMFFFINNQA